jgi:hypothetical protein
MGRLSFVAARVIGRISDPSVLNRPVCGEGRVRSVAVVRSAGKRRCSETGRDAECLWETAEGRTQVGVADGTAGEPVDAGRAGAWATEAG